MTKAKVDVYELIAWDLDDYLYRSMATGDKPEELEKIIKSAQRKLGERAPYKTTAASVEGPAHSMQDLLEAASQRDDMKQEYKGLDWKLGLVDLRQLLAFQRRLVFDLAWSQSPLPQRDNWADLFSFALGSQRGTEHTLAQNGSAVGGLDITLYSRNPDLQLRLHRKSPSHELSSLLLYGGSPFFEVAEFRGRWFLRDGYHRAYRLLQAGVYLVPAVVIYSRSIDELGATDPWFFNEEQLFSARPPRVTDFLDEDMVLCYERTALRKIIRIRIEETLEPVDEIEEA